MDALKLANEIRAVRCAIKRQIATGETSVAKLLADPPPELGNMTVSELLMAQHRWGADRTRKLCQALTISELRRVGSLTVRERDRISGMLGYVNPERVEWAA